MNWKQYFNRGLSTSATVGLENQVALNPLEFLLFRRWKKHFVIFISALATVILVTRLFPIDSLVAQPPVTKNNAIIFVTDGLRPSSVNATDTPTLYGIAQRGVQHLRLFRQSLLIFVPSLLAVLILSPVLWKLLIRVCNKGKECMEVLAVSFYSCTECCANVVGSLSPWGFNSKSGFNAPFLGNLHNHSRDVPVERLYEWGI